MTTKEMLVLGVLDRLVDGNPCGLSPKELHLYSVLLCRYITQASSDGLSCVCGAGSAPAGVAPCRQAAAPTHCQAGLAWTVGKAPALRKATESVFLS